MKTKHFRKLTLAEIQNIKYFFLLAMENYFGDKKELMKMANIDKELLNRFFDEKQNVIVLRH